MKPAESKAEETEPPKSGLSGLSSLSRMLPPKIVEKNEKRTGLSALTSLMTKPEIEDDAIVRTRRNDTNRTDNKNSGLLQLLGKREPS